jgi:hypothetical protein
MHRNDFHLAVSRLFNWIKIPHSNTIKDGYHLDNCGFFIPKTRNQDSIGSHFPSNIVFFNQEQRDAAERQIFSYQ